MASAIRQLDPASARVLVVGAGGIGCELLKNLVLSGFRQITVVDLDVIELSNLNRQFLFRRHHIGQSKASVAAEAVKRMAPDVALDICPYWADIKDTRYFPISFFRQFELVLNALDNLDARRYVNNVCLTVGVAIVESGTAGYLGQTSVILPGRSECFDCTAKERPREFPVCTIRTTPSTLIHCIVWAKEFLLPRLLGPITEEEEMYPQDEDDSVIASLKSETEAFRSLREMDQNPGTYAQEVFDKIYGKDVHNLRELKELWETRTPPIPLQYTLDKLSAFDRVSADEHQVWPLESWLVLFRDSLNVLHRRPDDSYFDKDDEEVMDFVAAAANIRAHVFGIALASRFSLKSMAGNIIPAIATTNAIVAGQIILQALNILHYLNSFPASMGVDPSVPSTLCNAFITYGARRRTLFVCERLSSPNPQCAVCRVDRAIAHINVTQTTLGALIDAVLKAYYGQHLGMDVASMEREDLSVLEGNRILFDESIGGNQEKMLAELGCGEARFIRFDHIHRDTPLLVAISRTEGDKKAISFEFTLLPATAFGTGLGMPVSTKEKEEGNVATCTDELAIEEPPAKVAKLASTTEDNSIELSDGDDDLTILS